MLKMIPWVKYSRVPTQGSDFSDIASTDQDATSQDALVNGEKITRRSSGWMKRRREIVIASLILLAVLLSITLTSLYWLSTLDTLCLDRHSMPSPALSEIDNKYYTIQFNGSLDYPSVYRQDPGPETDAAWDNLEDVRIMSISEEALLAAGKDTDAIRIPEKWGGGYMASLEVNHQLHCLNFLRKSLYWEYYQTRSVEFTDEPEMVHTHLLHCVEMLRQFIMCNADVGVITHKWVKDYPRPYPDFNTWHKCRNFDNVLQWAKDNQLQGAPGGPPLHHQWTPETDAVVFEEPP